MSKFSWWRTGLSLLFFHVLSADAPFSLESACLSLGSGLLKIAFNNVNDLFTIKIHLNLEITSSSCSWLLTGSTTMKQSPLCS
jgi:hypothetical protein